MPAITSITIATPKAYIKPSNDSGSAMIFDIVDC